MKPLLFSHRGDTRCFTENTLKAFKASLDSGVLGIETDVQLSSYGELLLFHDDKLDRLMNVTGFFHDLKKEDIDSFRFSKGEQIPKLDTLLIWLKENPSMRLYLELKFPDFCNVDYVEKMVTECIKSLTRLGFPENSIIGSFDLRAVKMLNKYLKDFELDLPIFVISETLAKVEEAESLGLGENLSLRIDLYKSLGDSYFEKKKLAVWGLKVEDVDATKNVFAWVPDL